MASLSDLAEGTARVFRAGGTSLLLLRDSGEVLAFDGSCISQDRSLRGRELVQAVIECLTPEATAASILDIAALRRETEDFRLWPRFATALEGEEIWVNVNEPFKA